MFKLVSASWRIGLVRAGQASRPNPMGFPNRMSIVSIVLCTFEGSRVDLEVQIEPARCTWSAMAQALLWAILLKLAA